MAILSYPLIRQNYYMKWMRLLLLEYTHKNKTDCKSYMYNVPEQFKSIKKELNESLTTALFSDRVLLIEGPSEKALFEKYCQLLVQFMN